MEQPTGTQHSIVGSWLVTVHLRDGTTPPYLFTFTADSCLTVSGPPVFPPDSGDPHAASGSPVLSAGHGTWESIDANNVILTFVRLVVDKSGAFLGRRVTRALVGFENGSTTWGGQFSTEVLAPAGEEVLFDGGGSFRAERILAEEPQPGGVIRGVKP